MSSFLFIDAVIGNAILVIMLIIAIHKKNKPWIAIMAVAIVVVNIFIVFGFISFLENCRINGIC
nr:hypothetical protein [Candidatus Sigynarchaeota archaeon]